MPKKFEKNRIKIKGGCQSGIKVVTHDSKSDLPLPLWKTCLKRQKFQNCSIHGVEFLNIFPFSAQCAVPATDGQLD